MFQGVSVLHHCVSKFIELFNKLSRAGKYIWLYGQYKINSVSIKIIDYLMSAYSISLLPYITYIYKSLSLVLIFFFLFFKLNPLNSKVKQVFICYIFFGTFPDTLQTSNFCRSLYINLSVYECVNEN